jgi:hypothetical protein
MASAQPALHLDSHVHPFTETCPTCDQPIPNETAKEIRARAAATEKRLAAEAEARAAQRLAEQKAEIEKAAKIRIEQVEREKAEAIKKADAETEAKIQAAKLEAQKLAATRVADAEKQIEAAIAKAREVEAQRDATIESRVREVREAMEKHETEALAAVNSANDEKLRKALAEVDGLKRQLEQRRADELGEGAHIQLLDTLKAAFPGDNIRRIRRGASGADILLTFMHNGQECGTIIYENKNTTHWRDEYVDKLVRDQTAAQADHAILATLAFPKKTSQVEIRDGVIIVNPARVVAITQLLRKYLLHVHTLRLSKSERAGKMAGLYDFIISERYRLLAARLDTESDGLLALQEADKRYHDNHWKKEGLAIISIQKMKAEIDTAIESIIGVGPQSEERNELT